MESQSKLLVKVLENATQSRHLIVLGFPIGFSGAITRLITDMCKTSINTLDVVADAHFFDVMESLRGDLDSIRNLTLRLGKGPDCGPLVDPGFDPDDVGPDAGSDADPDVDPDVNPHVNPDIDGAVIYSRMLRLLKKFPRLRSIRFCGAWVGYTAPALFKEIQAVRAISFPIVATIFSVSRHFIELPRSM
ncbi:hypothetical protein BS47DRAFT_369625 [Hydnum rufescens UP504]|uniref:Uncharacterized protein n=1 Tax=Hydnum rufescens UP504 TaxID=1448309 RepID=A0A9P6AJB4_9AGAM|nr:hypothetical protein BS47DRAFT_369625 [Hydnum rufescens UP504]